MVCVPCFIVPVLLYLWHKFLQPYVLMFWNPWAVQDANGNNKSQLELSCEGGVCAFRRKPVENKSQLETNDTTGDGDDSSIKDTGESKVCDRLKEE